MKDANLVILLSHFNQIHVTAVSGCTTCRFISVTDFFVDYRMQRFEELNERLELTSKCVYRQACPLFSLREDTDMNVSCYVHYFFIDACSVMFAYIYISCIMYNMFLD